MVKYRQFDIEMEHEVHEHPHVALFPEQNVCPSQYV